MFSLSVKLVKCEAVYEWCSDHRFWKFISHFDHSLGEIFTVSIQSAVLLDDSKTFFCSMISDDLEFCPFRIVDFSYVTEIEKQILMHMYMHAYIRNMHSHFHI